MKRQCGRVLRRIAGLVCLVALIYTVKLALFPTSGMVIPTEITERGVDKVPRSTKLLEVVKVKSTIYNLKTESVRREVLKEPQHMKTQIQETKAIIQTEATKTVVPKEVHFLDKSETHWTYPPFVENNPTNGPGEYGQAVPFSVSKFSGHEKKLYDEGMKRHGYNQFIGDKISIRRRVKDVRHQKCKERIYRKDLPEASVVIIFYNEAWTTLLRTVHSVIDQSPPYLLREIILVDDFSSFDYLKDPLDKYMKTLKKVKIVRPAQRVGLIRARLLGYAKATAPVLIFLDCHIECFPGWMEPLLDRIRENPNILAFPKIEIIDMENFSMPTSVTGIGDFKWQSLEFKWKLIGEDPQNKFNPVRSPTMPGGLFAINRDYFTQLGGYDPHLDFWGSENLELSFKVWMCNGTVELIPCSHVAHLFRLASPISWPASNQPLMRNALRVAEVWMDEYKLYIFEQFNFTLDTMGDVTERKELRERLHCKSFDWYMKNLLPEKYVPRDVLYAGNIVNVGSDLCVDSLGKATSPALFGCHTIGTRQFWYLKRSGQLSQADQYYLCSKNKQVITTKIKCTSPYSPWEYRKDKSLYNTDAKLCLQGNQNNSITLNPCDSTRWQQWNLSPRRRLNSVYFF